MRDELLFLAAWIALYNWGMFCRRRRLANLARRRAELS